MSENNKWFSFDSVFHEFIERPLESTLRLFGPSLSTTVTSVIRRTVKCDFI